MPINLQSMYPTKVPTLGVNQPGPEIIISADEVALRMSIGGADIVRA